MATECPIIDAWIQHPTPEFVSHDMFAALRRWMGMTDIPAQIPAELTLIPAELTLGALDVAGITRALVSAPGTAPKGRSSPTTASPHSAVNDPTRSSDSPPST